eukprot:5032640-Amphidinium_carterae.1
MGDDTALHHPRKRNKQDALLFLGFCKFLKRVVRPWGLVQAVLISYVLTTAHRRNRQQSQLLHGLHECSRIGMVIVPCAASLRVFGRITTAILLQHMNCVARSLLNPKTPKQVK